MKKIHLITSTYNDIHKFNWKNLIDFSEFDLFLYRKNDDLKIGESIKTDEFIDIPNYGSCEYAFFFHIVNNYENLAEFNVFTKMNLYEDHFRNFTEVFSNAKNYDFYQGGGNPISHIWYNDKTTHFLDLPTKYTKVPMNLDITKDKKVRYDGVSQFNGSEFEYFGNADGQVDWFNYLFGNDNPPGEVCTYQHGPCFSVSRNLILRHPKSIYEYFLNIFHPFKSWDYEIAKIYFSTNCKNNNWIIEKKDDIKYQAWGVGRRYHDELLRFYRVFFTNKVDENKYKIQKL
jgi:hypothetical protein